MRTHSLGDLETLTLGNGDEHEVCRGYEAHYYIQHKVRKYESRKKAPRLRLNLDSAADLGCSKAHINLSDE